MIGMFWMASQSQMCLTSEWNLLRNNIGQQANAKVGAGEYFGKFQILDIACILNYQLLQHNYIKDYSPLLAFAALVPDWLTGSHHTLHTLCV